MISAPQKIHSHAAEEIIEEKIENNIEDEAELKQISAEIANGTISPKEMDHYKEGLFRTQKAGMKSKNVVSDPEKNSTRPSSTYHLH